MRCVSVGCSCSAYEASSFENNVVCIFTFPGLSGVLQMNLLPRLVCRISRIIAGQKFSNVYLTRKLADRVRVFECWIANCQISV